MHGLTNKYIMSPVEDDVVSDIYVLSSKTFFRPNKVKKVSGPPAWSIFCQVKTHRHTNTSSNAIKYA